MPKSDDNRAMEIAADTPFRLRLIHMLDQHTNPEAVELFVEWLSGVPEARLPDAEPILGAVEGILRMEWESDDECASATRWTSAGRHSSISAGWTTAMGKTWTRTARSIAQHLTRSSLDGLFISEVEESKHRPVKAFASSAYECEECREWWPCAYMKEKDQ